VLVAMQRLAADLWRADRNLVRVNGSNDGNVVLDNKSAHAGGDEADRRERPLGAGAEIAPDCKYRVMVFDGCRASITRMSCARRRASTSARPTCSADPSS
jgi:hypothetical protein